MFKRYYIIFLLIISFKMVNGIERDIPIQIEINEDAINLFLLKQYNDLGDLRYIEGSLYGEAYYVGLLPFTIDLLDDEIKLNWGFELEFSSYPNVITFTDDITFDFPSGRTTAKLIFQQFESLVSSLGLPTTIENEIINRFQNIQLFAYQDELIKDVQNEAFYKQHPIELVDPYFIFGWDAEVNKLIITITTKLEAETPIMQYMIEDNNDSQVRLNFEGELTYMYFNTDTEGIAPGAYVPNFPNSELHDIPFGSSFFDQTTYNQCIIHITTDTHVYQGYFDIDEAIMGEWLNPYLLIK